MPRIAKTYITLIICAGATILLFAAGSWSSFSLRQFGIFLGLVAVSSTLKVRIPGIEGTMSPNFVFLVLGMSICSLSEVAAIALVAALVQSLWAAKNPRLVQVVFSGAALVLSATLARQFAHLLFGPNALNSPVALVILAGCLYFSLNTAMVSAVIGLVEGKPLVQVASMCYERVFPYFIGGVVFVGLISISFSRDLLWRGAIVLLPVVILGYMHTLAGNLRASAPRSQPLAKEDEELVEVGSYSPSSRR
jgi:hypothetical protein